MSPQQVYLSVWIAISCSRADGLIRPRSAALVQSRPSGIVDSRLDLSSISNVKNGISEQLRGILEQQLGLLRDLVGVTSSSVYLRTESSGFKPFFDTDRENGIGHDEVEVADVARNEDRETLSTPLVYGSVRSFFRSP